jgi:predicted DNA-binding protein
MFNETPTKTKDPRNTLYPLIAFRLDPSMAEQIEAVAKEIDVSKSKLIKTAVNQYLTNHLNRY